MYKPQYIAKAVATSAVTTAATTVLSLSLILSGCTTGNRKHDYSVPEVQNCEVFLVPRDEKKQKRLHQILVKDAEEIIVGLNKANSEDQKDLEDNIKELKKFEWFEKNYQSKYGPKENSKVNLKEGLVLGDYKYEPIMVHEDISSPNYINLMTKVYEHTSVLQLLIADLNSRGYDSEKRLPSLTKLVQDNSLKGSFYKFNNPLKITIDSSVDLINLAKVASKDDLESANIGKFRSTINAIQYLTLESKIYARWPILKNTVFNNKNISVFDEINKDIFKGYPDSWPKLIIQKSKEEYEKGSENKISSSAYHAAHEDSIVTYPKSFLDFIFTYFHESGHVIVRAVEDNSFPRISKLRSIKNTLENIISERQSIILSLSELKCLPSYEQAMRNYIASSRKAFSTARKTKDLSVELSEFEKEMDYEKSVRFLEECGASLMQTISLENSKALPRIADFLKIPKEERNDFYTAILQLNNLESYIHVDTTYINSAIFASFYARQKTPTIAMQNIISADLEKADSFQKIAASCFLHYPTEEKIKARKEMSQKGKELADKVISSTDPKKMTIDEIMTEIKFRDSLLAKELRKYLFLK